MKKIRRSPVVAGLLFLLAVVLLFAGSVGGTQAALQIYSSDYISAFELDHIGITLYENGTPVSFRNYGDAAASGFTEKQDGDLVLKTLEDDPSFQIGRKYPFVITCKNTGTIDHYLRVTVYKYWVQVGEGEKFGLKGWFHGLSSNTEKLLDKEKHSPATIHLGYNGSEGYNTSAWAKDPDSSTAERDVYYYTGILPVGGETAPLFDTLWVDSSVAKSVITKTVGSLTTYTYAYDGYGFVVQAEADAVQTHNAKAAIRSAWGLQSDAMTSQMNIPAE
ncbi:MAG: hypothetical protein IIY43_09735 [Oscillospiraceae bacterium]|nr:hypothetical protein [Oscillospiraceae bacterium]